MTELSRKQKNKINQSVNQFYKDCLNIEFNQKMDFIKKTLDEKIQIFNDEKSEQKTQKALFYLHQLMSKLERDKEFFAQLEKQKKFSESLEIIQETQELNIKENRRKMLRIRPRLALASAVYAIGLLLAVLFVISLIGFAGSVILFGWTVGLGLFIPQLVAIGIPCALSILKAALKEPKGSSRLLAAARVTLKVLLVCGLIAGVTVGLAFLLPLIAPLTVGFSAIALGIGLAATIAFWVLCYISYKVSDKLGKVKLTRALEEQKAVFADNSNNNFIKKVRLFSDTLNQIQTKTSENELHDMKNESDEHDDEHEDDVVESEDSSLETDTKNENDGVVVEKCEGDDSSASTNLSRVGIFTPPRESKKTNEGDEFTKTSSFNLEDI